MADAGPDTARARGVGEDDGPRALAKRARPRLVALGWPDAEPAVAFLAQGAYHANHVLRSDGRVCVARLNVASQWGLQPAAQLAREHSTLEALAATGVAPAPLGMLDGEPPVLLEELVEGRSFDLRRDLAALGAALAPVHTTEVAARAGHLPAVDALAALETDGRKWLERARAAGEDADAVALLDAHLAGLRRAIAPPPGPGVVVHTDLNPSNLVMTGERCRLLDWEAARLGDPAWDLAHAVSPTTSLWDDADPRILASEEVDAFLTAYAGAARRPVTEVTAATRAWLPTVAFRALAWTLGARVHAAREGRTLEAALAARLGRYRSPQLVRSALDRCPP